MLMGHVKSGMVGWTTTSGESNKPFCQPDKAGAWWSYWVVVGSLAFECMTGSELVAE